MRKPSFWKAPLSLRVRQALRVELEQFAAQKQRSLANVGALLLEWALEQLKAAGSTERLLKSKLHISAWASCFITEDSFLSDALTLRFGKSASQYLREEGGGFGGSIGASAPTNPCESQELTRMERGCG